MDAPLPAAARRVRVVLSSLSALFLVLLLVPVNLQAVLSGGASARPLVSLFMTWVSSQVLPPGWILFSQRPLGGLNEPVLLYAEASLAAHPDHRVPPHRLRALRESRPVRRRSTQEDGLRADIAGLGRVLCRRAVRRLLHGEVLYCLAQSVLRDCSGARLGQSSIWPGWASCPSWLSSRRCHSSCWGSRDSGPPRCCESPDLLVK